MDRIRKAIDFARQDRARLQDLNSAEPRASNSSAPTRDEASDAFSGVIEYTKTRIYVPSPALLESNRVIDPSRTDPVAAAFRILRTQVLQRMDGKGWRSLAALSPNVDDGKTTTAINLAVSLAYDHRHTVLLVDCDLKRPSIAKTLGIVPELGLDDVLTGDARVEDCLYHPEGFERLVILPTRRPLSNSSEALSGPKAHELIRELRGRYPERIIVFDLPPIIGSDDALAFLPMVDCGLMIVSEGLTRREDLLRSMELLIKTPIVGTVLNRSTNAERAYA